ncbi:MAG TPA: flavin reductase [Vicinamibacterales bacterium]|nr:flavin reductase [Vicinamibacterales bacterium]
MAVPSNRRVFLAQPALAILAARAAAAAVVMPTADGAAVQPGPRRRAALAKPGPMLPPSQAIITSVRGRPGDPDELSVLWTFVVNGDPAQIGVAAGDEHIAGGLIALHKEFVLNVPVASMIHGFDVIDFSSGKPGDKFQKSGFTRGQAAVVNAPTVNEAPIQLECRLLHTLRVPPMRTVFIAEVVATTVHEGICDADGRLEPEAAAYFGMAAGCGEFFTLGQKVGHIGQSVGRSDIRY